MSLTTSARRARRWLKATAPSKATAPLRRLGLWLCDRIERPEVAETTDTPSRGWRRLPSPSAILALGRRELLDLAQAIALSSPPTRPDVVGDRRSWARILGGTALSFARVGDVSAVASLVRAAARLRLRGPWLDEAQAYLLDQQQPDGSFGLLAPELALVRRSRDRTALAFRVTAEVLWAFAEVAEERARS
jgi:hypothetical protein